MGSKIKSNNSVLFPFAFGNSVLPLKTSFPKAKHCYFGFHVAQLEKETEKEERKSVEATWDSK